MDLGATMVTLVEPLVRFLGWPEAVYLRTVPPTSLAAKAGLKAGDLIIAVGSATAQRPAAPAPSQETKIDSVGELNDAIGLRGGDPCVWVRLIRPPAAVIAAIDGGSNRPTPAGTLTWHSFAESLLCRVSLARRGVFLSRDAQWAEHDTEHVRHHLARTSVQDNSLNEK